MSTCSSSSKCLCIGKIGFIIPKHVDIRLLILYRLFRECDGAIFATNSVFEREGLEASSKWFGSRPVLALGPLSPPASPREMAKEKATPVGKEVCKFLDSMLKEYGPHSVVYVSKRRLQS